MGDWRRVVVLVVALAACAGAWPAGVRPAAAEPGALSVEAVPDKTTAVPFTSSVRVSNGGGEAVTGVTLEVGGSEAMTATFDRSDLGTIAPGASVLVELTLDGRPGVAVVKAVGQSGDVPVAAATAVEVQPPPPHTMALVGATQLRERSPAGLRVVVTNASDLTVKVKLSATAGEHTVELERAQFTVPSKGAEDVGLTLRAARPTRRGTVGLVVRAEITGGGTQSLVATRELAVSVAADELPGPLGVGSALAVPGLVALLAFFEVRSRDRRRIGVPHPGAGAVWDNKTWVLLGGALSFAAAALYRIVGGPDLLEVPTVSDIVTVTLGLGLLGLAVGWASVAVHRRRVPIITGRSSPADVLRAAQRNSNELSRRRYKIAGDRHGLLVHRDGGAVVLTPPIEFGGGAVFDAWNATTDTARFANVVSTLTSDFDGTFGGANGNIDAPVAVPVEQAVEDGREEILRYMG